MKTRSYKLGLLACLAAGICGCVEKRISWSPDGKYGAVIGADGLYICNAEGDLSPRMLADAGRVAWFPDSRRVLVAIGTKAAKWKDVASTISADRQKQLMDAGAKLREELLAFKGDLEAFEPRSTPELTPGEFVAAGLYVRDQLNEGLQEKLGDKWGEMQDWSTELWSLQIYEISDKPRPAEGQTPAAMDLSAGGLKAWAIPGPVIMRSLDEIAEPRVSPDGKAATYLSPAPIATEDSRRLMVTTLEASPSQRVVDEMVANYPDWSADSRSLVYAKAHIPLPKGNETMRLGSVVRRGVRDEKGALLGEFAEPESLAGVVFDDNLRVRSLKNGSVIFTAIEVSLPSTPKDMPQHASLFMIDANRQATLAHLVPREAEERIGDAPFLFEVSPDEALVSIPGSHGKVSVLAIATGELTEIDWGDGDKLRTIPVWRTSTELCFAVKPGSEHTSPGRAEVVVCDVKGGKAGSVRTISRKWPDAMADFLKKDEEKKEGEEGGGEKKE